MASTACASLSQRAAVFYWLVAWPVVMAKEDLHVINVAPQALSIRWLESGVNDKGEGVGIDSVAAGTLQVPSTKTINTHQGHAFRLQTKQHRLKSFSYEGGPLNVAVVKQNDLGMLDCEFVGTSALTHLAIDIYRQCGEDQSCWQNNCKSPRMHVSFPEGIVDTIFQELSPMKNTPEVVHLDGGLDGFIILSGVNVQLDVHWAWASTSTSEDNDVPRNHLFKVSKVSASSDAVLPSALKLKASPRQIFLATSSDGTLKSKLFEYPGETAVAAVAQRNETALEVEIIEEDVLKILISEVAHQCAKEAKLNPSGTYEALPRKTRADLKECRNRNLRLPSTGLAVPSILAGQLFTSLWETPEHWWLCSYQSATEPIRRLNISLEASNKRAALYGDVLREDPLVVALHNFAGEEECREIVEQAGNEALGMAHVGGGGRRTTTSRARRTLTRNMWPDFADPTSALTKVSSRFFEATRTITGYELYPEGQEPVNYLYYKPGYEYRPHCDGDCGAERIGKGMRVASSLLYCAVAEEGGGTVFTEDKVKLQPKKGMWMLFTYNPDPHAVSKHSACPVLKGTKITATQWYREGVSKQKPWDHRPEL